MNAQSDFEVRFTDREITAWGGMAVMKSGIHHTLATLHHKVFAAGAFWDSNAEKNVLRLAVTRR